jgi:predicted amidohydrolase YtcJ
MPLDALVTGRIATFAGTAGFGWVEAVGIRDGRVAFAGSAVDLESRADPHTRRVELEPGEIGLPGLTDAHLHLADAALAAREVDLSAAATLEAGLAAVAAGARRVPQDGWILGGGWDQRRWGRWPRATDLAAVAAGRLVALWSFDHHALWVSPAALALAGIGATTEPVAGGIIRRLDDGTPDGILLENACGLVADRIPPPSDETLSEALRALAGELLGLGVVGVHDPGPIYPDPELRTMEVYATLADAGDLPLRVHLAVRDDSLATALERALRSGASVAGDPEGRIHVGWLKLFADGTLGSGTAALLEPGGEGEDPGVFVTPPVELAELAGRAAAGGIATQIHAIGDAAVRTALDALAPTVGQVRYMPRLEHVQLCSADDRPRFATLGIAASVQPVHLREDAATARRDWGTRAERDGYAYRSLVDARAVVCFGTDAPVEPIDPWPGIAMAVLRRSPSWGSASAPFGPDQALTLEQALRAATVGPAATLRDPLGGRLIPGSPADLVVLPAAPAGQATGGAGTAAESGSDFEAVRPRLVMLAGDVVVER